MYDQLPQKYPRRASHGDSMVVQVGRDVYEREVRCLLDCGVDLCERSIWLDPHVYDEHLPDLKVSFDTDRNCSMWRDTTLVMRSRTPI